MIIFKDNSEKSLTEFSESTKKELKDFSHKSLNSLVERGNVILVSNNIEELKKSTLWSIYDNLLKTNNLMGFIGLSSGAIKITSRFTDNAEKDYFLHYMLQKVFLGQIVNLDIETNQSDNIWDFFYYLFPHYLNQALLKGLYKEYIHKKYNDINVRGAIDVSRHIKKNSPFLGNIAYNTREHSYNNRITHLIRHTIEYIEKIPIGRFLLNTNSIIRENIETIKQLTPNYHIANKQKVMRDCKDKISNSYWNDYEDLRNLCLKILNQEKLTFDKSNDKVHGILFDGAWLWEEYLATFLPKDFIHPDNRKGKNGIKLASNGLLRFPDFYSKQKKIVMDAKYKRIAERRDDTHQMLAYMYGLEAEKAILIFPSLETESLEDFKLLGYGKGDATLFHITMQIAREKENTTFQDFCKEMNENEKNFCQLFSKDS